MEILKKCLLLLERTDCCEYKSPFQEFLVFKQILNWINECAFVNIATNLNYAIPLAIRNRMLKVSKQIWPINSVNISFPRLRIWTDKIEAHLVGADSVVEDDGEWPVTGHQSAVWQPLHVVECVSAVTSPHLHNVGEVIPATWHNRGHRSLFVCVRGQYWSL